VEAIPVTACAPERTVVAGSWRKFSASLLNLQPCMQHDLAFSFSDRRKLVGIDGFKARDLSDIFRPQNNGNKSGLFGPS
jgi:hypothetical protein